MWPKTSSKIAYWAYWLPRATASLDFERNPPIMAYRETRVERKTILILALNLIGTPQLASVLLILNRDRLQKQGTCIQRRHRAARPTKPLARSLAWTGVIKEIERSE